MKVLIVKENQEIFKQYNPKFVFEDKTKNTCTFIIPAKKFGDLYRWVKDQGFNPFALMVW